MPNTDSLLLEMLLRSGLAQYPDKKLYNAAVMLKPEERPTAPVTLAPQMEGATYNPDTNSIAVGARGAAYRDKNLRRLAAILAHEGVHSKGTRDEAPAYQMQLDVLKRLGETDKDLLKILAERAAGGPIKIVHR